MPAAVGSTFIIKDPAVVIDALLCDGWRVLGPRLADGAIIYSEIAGAADLPRGVIDEQDAGHYRLRQGRPSSWFEFVVSPHSWKQWLFPARHRLWSARKADGDDFLIEEHVDPWPKTALFGIRSCDIAALAVLDRVFMEGQVADPGYRRRRQNTLIIAVQCSRSASTCFCQSVNTGPRAEAGFDLALTELGEAGDDRFLVEIGSAQGTRLLDGAELALPQVHQLAAAEAAYENACNGQRRRMTPQVAGLLRDNLDHPRWSEVAGRCLSCANCTLACPTCFCSDVEDVNDLTGAHTERWRVWDSCFTADFSYIHGGSVRRSTRSRYRQWLTHKLSTWHDQFGMSGCIGCGRCITWCPVGIDLTEEAAAIAASPSKPEG